ncbi:nickel-dependent lactate racemase [Clostridium chromiireducens]|uniref:Nickel-dependent lactate racemase n=1 Tax=Clostridium chromiireducens TaxID=225345 RepID=A0A964RS65_9CLOT|nr:nickel-dependent lactate racemase [Clostridium chromiireducens]MVX66613.1 nickel-dependent lactate racemase [Clostridium chromiireducens]
MAIIEIPYSTKSLKVNVEDKNLKGILVSKANSYRADCSQNDIVNRSLDNCIGSKSLEELVKDKHNMVIITSDHTRPVPSKITMPILLERVRNVNPSINIKILIATGFHRPTTKEEMINKFGQNIVDNEEIINHVSTDEDSLVSVGILPSGGELFLNKLAMETELLIAEGFIEPHFFAGFSGGRKSILPGIASAKTIMANHCSEFINSNHARTGIIKDNPIHKDMLYAAEKSNLAFILNVVIDENKNIINAFAGDSKLAHEEGCKFVMDLSSVKSIEADIVVSSNGGYPLDQNIYQAVKGMTAAEATCKKGGVIIMIAACNDGHGGQSFYDTLANSKGPEELLERILKVPRNETIPDQWEIQILARILSNYTVIVVTDVCDPNMITSMHMKHAYTFDEALNQAYNIKGKDADVVVIPNGVGVVVEK